jgi:hypothetical protein
VTVNARREVHFSSFIWCRNSAHELLEALEHVLKDWAPAEDTFYTNWNYMSGLD